MNQGQAVLEPDSGLPQNTATVTGGIGQRAINLTLTQVKCEDPTQYNCEISYEISSDGYLNTRGIYYRNNLTVTGKSFFLLKGNVGR